MPSKLLIALIALVFIILTCSTIISMRAVPEYARSAKHSLLRSNTHSELIGSRNESVAFIIRSHGGYANSLMSLLWSFEAQFRDTNILALVLPTEFEATQVLHNHMQRHWTNYFKGSGKVLSTKLMSISQQEYDDHCCHLQSICVDEWRHKLMNGGWTEDAVNRYCEVNSPLHYYLTDRAISWVLSNCSTCEYVVVTNADNSYTPDYLLKSIASMEANHHDIVLVDMLHRGKAMQVYPENGKLDLGCALIRTDFLRRNGISFLSSLPQPAEPQHYHDADYWMINNCINHKASVGYIREVLFNHN
jgi:hypothetical protein